MVAVSAALLWLQLATAVATQDVFSKSLIIFILIIFNNNNYYY